MVFDVIIIFKYIRYGLFTFYDNLLDILLRETLEQTQFLKNVCSIIELYSLYGSVGESRKMNRFAIR